MLTVHVYRDAPFDLTKAHVSAADTAILALVQTCVLKRRATKIIEG